MSLRDKLKSRKPKEITVTIDGDDYLVRGLGRVDKNRWQSKLAAVSGKDTSGVEGELLAMCVCDPATGEPVMPDPSDWDIEGEAAGKLVTACLRVCGFDSDDTKTMGKGSSESDS